MATTRSLSFTVEEDIQLCHAYLDVSQDSIVGINQSGECLWRKIKEQYNKSEIAKKRPERQGRSLSCRMSTMQTACAKFRGCLNQIYNLNPSGASEYDIRRQANELFKQDLKYKKGFKFDHVWDLLKDTEKFANTQSSKAPTQDGDESSGGMYTVSSLQDETSPTPEEASPTISKRPIGGKKAKKMAQNGEQLKTLMAQNQILINAISKGTSGRTEMHRERLQVKRIKEENKRMKEENRILLADLSSETDPSFKAFIEEERAKIIRSRRDRGEGSGSQYRASQYDAYQPENNEDDEEPDEVPETQGDPVDHYSPYYDFLTGNNTNYPKF